MTRPWVLTLPALSLAYRHIVAESGYLEKDGEVAGFVGRRECRLLGRGRESGMDEMSLGLKGCRACEEQTFKALIGVRNDTARRNGLRRGDLIERISWTWRM
jgi:hypothetical protein